MFDAFGGGGAGTSLKAVTEDRGVGVGGGGGTNKLGFVLQGDEKRERVPESGPAGPRSRVRLFGEGGLCK